ncbi:MAG: ParB/RepB/Spo0J family partition protein [Salinisphaera sp.]|jgi:ParB family chromosome partitioning protein|nr:ParB/RepB/Spo0J family partition protein [Salinisphaera sp.]
MAQKRRGLGRGLESLLSKDLEAAAAHGALMELALDDLSPGRYQPRRDMDADALEALAQSIRAQGVVQPLVVRQVGDKPGSGYEIIAGERRWRASRLAGLQTVPAVVRDMPDEVAMAVALIENIQREDLNPLEESAALKRLIEECGMTHAACAQAVGRSRASVSNLLRLADLNTDVGDMLRAGHIEMGHARALLALNGPSQSDIAQRVLARSLTVRQTEALVRRTLSGEVEDSGAARRDAGLVRLESNLAERLHAGVKIETDRRGGGRVIIRYRNAEQLESLVNRFDKDPKDD